MRVLLADDHPLFAEGLKNLLIAHGIEVVGIAADGLEALEKARATRPDVILMDVFMPRCDGISATRLIKAELPATKVVMLTVSEADEHFFDAIRQGASGYLLKDMKASELVKMLSSLERGGTPLSPGMGAKLLKEFALAASRQAGSSETGGAGAREGLTPRQAEVLNLVAEGMTYAEVGAALSISERTVKYHMRQIMDQLHLRNRGQVLAHVARMRGGSGRPG